MRAKIGSKRRGLPKDLPKGYSWKDRFCKTCDFCIKERCRYAPPQPDCDCDEDDTYDDDTWYPMVIAMAACSKYKPKGQA
ncbi:hypothetical protein LCGC14_1093020 [marine sediment metagenome]|uniref:Uncharacterized protein n=1 Tax=marine sediment metagenome TaxID=412755 RepID=A0A0F9MG60_9ZZZZ